MRWIILILVCEVFCELPETTSLKNEEIETLTDLPREITQDQQSELESGEVEVKANSTWPVQITVYEETTDEVISEEGSNATSEASGTGESCPQENMEWNSCGARCAKACMIQPRGVRKARAICEPSLTIDGCYKGCFCKKDYVRLNDKCVLPVNCPIRNCFFANEEYKQCGTPCQLTCDSSKHANEIEARCPNDICVRGCFCKTGYVRSATGICILPTRCPRPLVS